ncbi:hypothetical protein [Priestia filamentosa]|uniref:hypothetical protein n=1 Tax=Priestia filamentosa TaxID=1402861 RepID=UPI002E1B052D|nr:hypothetical protein [Priestia filamentosa]
MNKEISRLQSLNIMLGWKVIYNNLLECEKENKKVEGPLLILKEELNDQEIEVKVVQGSFQVDWRRLSSSEMIKSVNVQHQDDLVVELENIIFKIDFRRDIKKPYNYIPLRVPTGWKIEYNTCINVDPDEISEKDDTWLDFTEDLLLLAYDDGRILIDVGWKREADPSGRFQLIFVIDEKWEEPEKLAYIRRPEELTSTIETIMQDVQDGKYDS